LADLNNLAKAKATRAGTEFLTLVAPLKNKRALELIRLQDNSGNKWLLARQQDQDEFFAVLESDIEEQGLRPLLDMIMPGGLNITKTHVEMKDSLEAVFGDLDIDDTHGYFELTKEMWMEKAKTEPLLELCPWVEVGDDPSLMELRCIDTVLKHAKDRMEFALKIRRKILLDAKRYDWKTARQAHWLRLVERKTLTDDDLTNISLFWKNRMKMVPKKTAKDPIDEALKKKKKTAAKDADD